MQHHPTCTSHNNTFAQPILAGSFAPTKCERFKISCTALETVIEIDMCFTPTAHASTSDVLHSSRLYHVIDNDDDLRVSD